MTMYYLHPDKHLSLKAMFTPRRRRRVRTRNPARDRVLRKQAQRRLRSRVR